MRSITGTVSFTDSTVYSESIGCAHLNLLQSLTMDIHVGITKDNIRHKHNVFINSFKPGVLFVGHRQTAQPQM